MGRAAEQHLFLAGQNRTFWDMALAGGGAAGGKHLFLG
jgi:hypothetical protein